MGQLISNKRAWNLRVSLWALAAGSCALSAPALAQQVADDAKTLADAAEASQTEKDDIVVTGTLIRGVAPTGSNVVGVNREQITSTGAATTNELLANIPQAQNMFNVIPQIAAGTGSGIQVLRPNLRNLPSGNTASGASTLILVDGHRTVNVGVDQAAPDPQTVPASLLERVEIVTNGGSALYGSDAVGGVINYITRRRFDGVEATARYGIGDDYYSFDASVTVGKAWSTGSIFAAYSHSENNSFFGRDRDYYRSINALTGQPAPATATCASPNITVGANRYVVSGSGLAAVSAPVTCDLTDYLAIIPTQRQDSVFAGMYQELSPSLKFEIRGYYSERAQSAIGQPEAQTITIRSPGASPSDSNPFYRAATPGSTSAQSIALNFGDVYDKTINNYVNQFGVTPQFTIDFAQNWQARVMFNYGRSHTSYRTTEVDTAALAFASNGNTLTRDSSTFLNPYDIAASSPAVINAIRNGERAGEAISELFNYRGIVDGTVMALPGGDVKLALGLEYLVDHYAFRRRSVTTAPGPIALPYTRFSRNIASAFGELQVPIFGEDNAAPLLHALTFAASARYDRYSDFGSTFNPKFGMTWQPVDWITVRASYGKSFNAPTGVDLIAGSTISAINSNSFRAGLNNGGYVVDNRPGALAAPAGAYAITLGGAQVGLLPQKATDWSIGADFEPPFLPGLRLGASYYEIDFRGFLGKPPLTGTPNTANVIANYPGVLIYMADLDPAARAAVIAAAQSQVSNPELALLSAAQAVNPAAQLYVIQDFRTRNLANSKLAGIDFSASYFHETGFGSIDARVAGNVRVRNESQLTPTLPYTNNLDNGSLWNLTASVGATVGDFRAQATLNRSAGSDVNIANVQSPTNPTGTTLQSRVGAFSVVNLFFSYDLKQKFMAESLQFTLNVNNVFNTDPPILRTTNGGTGTGNGQTIGRVFQLGVRTKF